MIDPERYFLIDNLLVRIHAGPPNHRDGLWTGLASWEFEFLFSESLMPTLLLQVGMTYSAEAGMVYA